MFLATLHSCESVGNTEFQSSKASRLAGKKASEKTKRNRNANYNGLKVGAKGADCWWVERLMVDGWWLRLSRWCQRPSRGCLGAKVVSRGCQGVAKLVPKEVSKGCPSLCQGVAKEVSKGAQGSAKGWPTAHPGWPDYWAGLRLAAVVAASACREPPTEPGRCPQPSKLTAGASLNISISNQPS